MSRVRIIFYFLIVELAKCDIELLILHTNDMHSRFDQTNVNGKPLRDADDAYGGFARLKRAVDEARREADAQNIPSLFLNAGDTFQGTAFYTLLKHEVVSSLIELLGIDVMSLGNHEFDDGVNTLSQYLKSIRTPVVAGNLDFAHEKQLQLDILTPYKVLQINRKKIGIVGYLLPETKNTSSTGDVIFHDEIESITEHAKRLKADGVDIIVALGHSGFEKDIQIAETVPHVSLVVGGHTNTFLYSPPDKPPSNDIPRGSYPYLVQQKSGRTVPVVQAYAFTKYLGKLWITFDENGDYVSSRPSSNPLLLDSSISQDSFVQQKVLEWKRKFDDIVHTVLGRINVQLDGWKSGCKRRECNLGNFVTDAFIYAAAEQYNGSWGWTDAAIALIQGAALRSAADETKTYGNYTYEEVLILLPYKTPLYKVRVRGADLKRALEQSISRYGQSESGEFLQVSGIQTTYDVSKPIDNRVVRAYVRCANCTVPTYSPLDERATYTVIMSQYLLEGGDGYWMFKNASSEPITQNDTTLTDTDAVARFVQRSKIVYPEIDGRIKIINDRTPITSKCSSFDDSTITLIVSLITSAIYHRYSTSSDFFLKSS